MSGADSQNRADKSRGDQPRLVVFDSWAAQVNGLWACPDVASTSRLDVLDPVRVEA